jgi:cell division septum initiation protein DivIVA
MRVFPSADASVPGVEEEPVSAFLTFVAQELGLVISERDQAVDDLAKLRRDGVGEAAHTQAMHLLARAQTNAEALVADARQTAADIARTARQHARDVVSTARRHADELKANAVREAATEAAMAAASAPAALQAETMGLRQYASVFRALMKTNLEAALAALEQWAGQEEKLRTAPDQSDWPGRYGEDRPAD